MALSTGNGLRGSQDALCFLASQAKTWARRKTEVFFLGLAAAHQV